VLEEMGGALVYQPHLAVGEIDVVVSDLEVEAEGLQQPRKVAASVRTQGMSGWPMWRIYLCIYNTANILLKKRLNLSKSKISFDMD
jgi:hypothetical protein